MTRSTETLAFWVGMTVIYGTCLAALATLACTPADRAALERDARTAADNLDKVCAERAATRDGGPLLVTDGCPASASNAFVRCTGGEAGGAP